MAARTFAQARTEILAYLASRGWKTSGPLKTPWAESPSGELSLWFKPQAVWYTTGNMHSMAGARSTWISDIRRLSGPEFLAEIDRMFHGRYGSRRRMTRATRRRR